MPSNQPRVRLFNIEIDCLTLANLLQSFDSGFLVTPNVDHLMLLQENPQMHAAYKTAEYVVVDSQIVFWALKFLGRAVPEKICGSDLLPAYCRHHANNLKTTVFILGGKHGIPEAAMHNINQQAGRELVIAAHSPTMQFGNNEVENNEVIDRINASQATCLVVGLGAPKQEIWIYKYRHRLLYAKTFLAVGAAIDFEAGAQPRSPKWMSAIGMEWAYRLIREPKRLWRRYLVRDPKFFWMVAREKWSAYKG